MGTPEERAIPAPVGGIKGMWRSKIERINDGPRIKVDWRLSRSANSIRHRWHVCFCGDSFLPHKFLALGVSMVEIDGFWRGSDDDFAAKMTW